MTVGERMKARRKELGMSADYVAERIGVSRSTVFRYESGDIEKLPVDSVYPIAKVLSVSPRWLMGWDDDEQHSDYYRILSTLSDKQLDSLLVALISDRDKDYLLQLAAKILEIASKK